MKALRDFQRDWARSTGAPLRISPDGSARAPTRDYAPALLAGIAAHADLDAADRLGAYRYQYWFRLFTLLQGDFPLLGRLLGWTRFDRLAQAHLATQRPGQDLSTLSTDFGTALLAGRHPGTWKEAVSVDLAWLRTFDAPSLPEPGPDHLPRIADGSCALVLQPSVSLLELRRDWVASRSATTAAPFALPPRRPCRWALSRKGESLHALPLDRAFLTLLRALAEGNRWHEALERTVALHPRCAKDLSDWFAAGSRAGLWAVVEE